MAKKTTKRKAVKKKAAKRARPATREANPSWLVSDPVGEPPKPPVVSRASNNLPFLQLRWEDFERLCRRAAALSGEVEAAWVYGGTGHKQLGIDILIRKKDCTFEVWQSKRHKKFGGPDVTAAIKLFLKHEWAKKAQRFVLAVACDLRDPKTIQAIEAQREKLSDRGIAFEVLEPLGFTDRLRSQPDIVDDFFDRPWVNAICPPEAVTLLENRISRFDIASIRARLLKLYTAWIAAVDPGLPIAGTDSRAKPIPAPQLKQRYVLPDVIVTLDPGSAESEPADPSEQSPAVQVPGPELEGAPADVVAMTRAPRAQEVRARRRSLSVDQFLTAETRAILTAEAGAGKTTLLRFIALEILSDASSVAVLRNRYSGFVPVWVPFALWTRMAEGKDHPPPLEDVVHAFIAAQSDVDLANDMRRVLNGDRTILLVDGLDEAQTEAASDTLLAVLTQFVERRNIPVFATSRPHGVRSLAGLGGNWTQARLAPLSEPQRHALARLWYHILERSELGAAASETEVVAHAERRAKSFMTALTGNAGIARLAQTPLFLVALLKLHRLGRDLPRNRFDASKEIVEQLLEHQPRRRAKDAVDPKAMPVEGRVMRDRLLSDFAFGIHSGGLSGTVTDGAIESEAIDRAARIILQRSGSGDREKAENQARSIFSFSEEGAGLLVKKSQDNIGFLHRSLQEYLVAVQLLQLTQTERVSFVRDHAGQVIWSEPILYLMFLVRHESENGQLLEAIETAPVLDAMGADVRDALLTQAVFADFAHDLAVVRRIAGKLFTEAELFAWGSRQQQLLSAVTDGLFSEALAERCANKLNEWVPDFFGYGVASPVQEMLGWPESTRPQCKPVLLRLLAGGIEYVWRSAAFTLAEFYRGDPAVKHDLLRMFHEPKSIDALQAVLFALGQGWIKDEDVGKTAAALRASSHVGIRVDAIRIRAARGETDASDLDVFCTAAFDRDTISEEAFAPDLIAHFAKTQKDGLIARIEQAFRTATRGNRDLPLLKALIAADAKNPLVHAKLGQVLQEDWMIHQLFPRPTIPLADVDWTAQLVTLIEEKLAKEKHQDYETYWIGKVLPLPSVKANMLASLVEPNSLAFWSARGLLEIWGKDDPDIGSAFRALLTSPPEKIAYIADYLPDAIDDKASCRQVILDALRAKPPRTDLLVAGIRKLVDEI